MSAVKVGPGSPPDVDPAVLPEVIPEVDPGLPFPLHATRESTEQKTLHRSTSAPQSQAARSYLRKAAGRKRGVGVLHRTGGHTDCRTQKARQGGGRSASRGTGRPRPS